MGYAFDETGRDKNFRDYLVEIKEDEEEVPFGYVSWKIPFIMVLIFLFILYLNSIFHFL